LFCLTVKLNDLVGAVETFELSLKLASLVGDEQAQDALKKALKDVNSKIAQGLKADDDTGDNDAPAEDTNQDGSSEKPQGTEDDGEKKEAVEDDGEKKEATEDDGEKKTDEDDDKPTENTEQEQPNA